MRNPVSLGACSFVTATALLVGLPAAVSLNPAQAQVVQHHHHQVAPVNPLAALSDAFRDLSETTKPSVVFLRVEGRVEPARRDAEREMPRGMPPQFREFFREFERMPQQPREIQGSGSGWVWDDQGHIVTNAHVIENADQIDVTFHDNTIVKAEVVGLDKDTDVAVIRLIHPEAVKLRPTPRAEKLAQQGELVFAFGSPFRYRFSVSQGIVSGLGRQTGILGREGYENFLQTDAAINPGNSGGPLTNVHGQVVGMNTAIFSRTGGFAGIGFAVPVDVVEAIVPQLIEYGEVSRGKLGVYIDSDPKLLQSFGLKRGVVVQQVVPNSPAAEADLKPGDVILQLNGKRVSTTHGLRTTIGSMRPGSKVVLSVWNDGETRVVPVTVGGEDMLPREAQAPAERDPVNAAPPGERLDALGFNRLRTITDDLARRMELPTERGVMVLGLEPRGAAAEAGLSRGSVITRVMDREVRTVDELSSELSQYQSGDLVRLRVVLPDGRAAFVVLEMPE